MSDPFNGVHGKEAKRPKPEKIIEQEKPKAQGRNKSVLVVLLVLAAAIGFWGYLAYTTIGFTGQSVVSTSTITTTLPNQTINQTTTVGAQTQITSGTQTNTLSVYKTTVTVGGSTTTVTVTITSTGTIYVAAATVTTTTTCLNQYPSC